MKKYRFLNIALAAAILAIGATACKKDEKVHANTAIILSGSNPGVNSCGWLVKVKDDTDITNAQNSLKPVNLPQQYQTDGMHVKITYTVPDMPVIQCASGPADLQGYTQINILSVQQVN
ncbi:hypothetical protein [Mucilaginibacter sp. HD30]